MKKKIKIDELKVQSFLTELSPETANTAKGGDDSTGEIITTIITYLSVAADKSLWPYTKKCETTTTTTTTSTTTKMPIPV